MKHVVIIGAGALGSCVGNLLKKNKKLFVEWWDSDAAKVVNRKELAKLIPRADAVLMCVPSWVFEMALAGIVPYVRKKTIIISFAKGIEAKTNATMDVLLQRSCRPGQPFVLVSGPMLAKEMTEGLPAGAVFATKDPRVFRIASSLFAGTSIIRCHSSDVRGVALAGVLKNIYAMALGAADGLELGMNVRGYLIVQAVNEMGRILVLLGGKGATAYSLAGMGDLIATGSSAYSKNYTVGRELARTGVCAVESEGKASLHALETLLGIRAKHFRLFQTVKALLACKKNPRDIVMHYFNSCE